MTRCSFKPSPPFKTPRTLRHQKVLSMQARHYAAQKQVIRKCLMLDSEHNVFSVFHLYASCQLWASRAQTQQLTR